MNIKILIVTIISANLLYAGDKNNPLFKLEEADQTNATTDQGFLSTNSGLISTTTYPGNDSLKYLNMPTNKTDNTTDKTNNLNITTNTTNESSHSPLETKAPTRPNSAPNLTRNKHENTAVTNDFDDYSDSELTPLDGNSATKNPENKSQSATTVTKKK